MKYIKMACFLIFTITPNLWAKPAIILFCGIGALVMYYFSERDNTMLKIKFSISNDELQDKLAVEKYNRLKHLFDFSERYPDLEKKNKAFNELFSDNEKLRLNKKGVKFIE